MKSYLSLLALLSLVLVAPNLRAQSTADVQPLLEEVAGAYRNLTAFSVTVETTQSSGIVERKVTTKLTLQRSSKLAAEITVGSEVKRVVSDGTTVYSDSSRNTASYVEQPVEKPEDAITALSRSGGGGVGLLPILLMSSSAQKQMIPGKPSSVKRLADESIGGDPCDVVTAIIGEGDGANRVQFSFGKQDHLLRRLTMGPAQEGAKPRAVEIHSNITLQPALTDATFKYTPAAGAVATSAPKEPDTFDPRLKIGAMPLSIAGKDLAGKEVSLDQYKGKVLLIDFWAIWCGPCVAELPNVVAAYNKYHDQGFEIVGVSLDEANAEQKLQKFIADNKMPWRQIYDGGHWEAANAKAYGVRAIPFTLLIGRDGAIAAVAARGEALAPAVEAALKKQ